MTDALAERLLARVMNWSQEDIARERPVLQFLAVYKYDEYQQFSPGMRFVESLAIWLNQFETLPEKQAAYNFIRTQLVFLSNAEFNYLVSSAYPDYIRPLLMSKVAEEQGLPAYRVGRIAKSMEFKALLRRTIFLGLSDGARTDVFRRSNLDISNEQIFSYYDMSHEKQGDVTAELATSLKNILGRAPTPEETTMKHVVLIDDFAGSGLSYLRCKENNTFSGKIVKFINQLAKSDKGFIANDACIHIVLYVATRQAFTHLTETLANFFSGESYGYSLEVIQLLEEKISNECTSGGFMDILNDDRYYDDNVEDRHMKIGNTDARRGFAGCSLPLVLTHNTPNNSIFLLWSDPSTYKVTGLFPRVSRHRKEL